MGLLRACQAVLLSGLLFTASQATSAQSAGKAPSQPQAGQPAQAADVTSAKSQTPPERVIKLADVVQMIGDKGRGISIRNYIAEGIGIKGAQLDSAPVLAHAVSDAPRELCIIDDTGALLFVKKDGGTTVVYLANHTGVLQRAGYFSTGRFHSQDFKSIPKEKAAEGFAAEKEFWIKKTANPNFVDAVKPDEPGKAAKQSAALNIPAPKAKEPKDNKSAEKSSKATPANTDEDATPKKKRISWF